jgi:ferredoxin-NADP reductase/DMSO/TMAO reductase YedYZ heme-binding membrane subunit
MSSVRFHRTVILINGAVPLALLVWDAAQGELGVNAANFAIRTTGILSLIFLVLSLAISPLRWLTGWAGWIGFRRALGLYGFGYALLHFSIYFVWDRDFSVSSTVDEILSRTYLQIGIGALLLMVPLAVTSTDAMVRRLGGKRWKLLHRLAYVVAIAGCIHYLLLVKADIRQPLAFTAVVAALLVARFVWHYFQLRKAAKRVPAVAAAPARPKFWRGELSVGATFDETHNIRTFRLVAPDGGDLPFDYRPGQYLNIELPVDGRPVKRSYTIASSPTRRGYCEITVKREDLGLASRHLHGVVKPGTRLKIGAPAGKFCFTGDGATSVVLIAGGVGITPLMSIARYLTERAWPGDIYFLFVAKTEADIIFERELEYLRLRHPRLHLCISLSRPGDAWTGPRGRLTGELFTRFVPDLTRQEIYLCGPDEMMIATRRLLEELRVPPVQIKTEAFVSPGVLDAAAAAPASAPAAPAVDDASEARLVTFAASSKSAELSADQTILDAAEDAGISIPFECRSGICGQCKTKLLHGRVSMDAEDALTAKEKSTGIILACQARPRGEVTVDA